MKFVTLVAALLAAVFGWFRSVLPKSNLKNQITTARKRLLGGTSSTLSLKSRPAWKLALPLLVAASLAVLFYALPSQFAKSTPLIFEIMLVGGVLLWFNRKLQRIRLRKRCDQFVESAREMIDAVRAKYPGCEGALNAVTTEPGLRVSRSKDITHEDFVDAIDRIEPAQTPLVSFCENEVKLGAVDRTWNVDSFPGAKGAVGRADNDAAGTARDWSTNVRKMGNIAQGFDEAWDLGWIAAQVPRIAGVKDIVAYARAGAYQLLKQHKEVSFSSFDQTANYDAGTGLGSIGAGYPKLIHSGNAYTAASSYAIGKPTDLHSAPSAATLSGSLTARHNRAMWKSIALELRRAAKKPGDWMAICGLTLRQAVTDLTLPSQVGAANNSAIASEQVRVLLRNESDSVLGATVDTIQTDFGRIMVTDSDYIGTTTNDSNNSAQTAWASNTTQRAAARFNSVPGGGLILKKGNLFKTWAITPYTVKLAEDGSGESYDAKELCMLGVRNPILGGFLNFT